MATCASAGPYSACLLGRLMAHMGVEPFGGAFSKALRVGSKGGGIRALRLLGPGGAAVQLLQQFNHFLHVALCDRTRLRGTGSNGNAVLIAKVTRGHGGTQ